MLELMQLVKKILKRNFIKKSYTKNTTNFMPKKLPVKKENSSVFLGH